MGIPLVAPPARQTMPERRSEERELPELPDSLCQLHLLPVVKARGRPSPLRSAWVSGLPAGAACLRNAQEPHSYLSPSLHLLELATSHFAGDFSVNS